jgi:DNA-binding CsgD family transcriptional regulator
MSAADIYAFHRALQRLKTPAECGALFRATIAPFGFDTFAAGLVDLGDMDRCVYYLIGWTETWRRFYLSSGLVERDPVVGALAARTEPFTWTDLRRDRTLPKLGTAALDLAAAEGWTEGFVVPLPRANNRCGLVSLAGHAVVDDPEARDFLSLACVLLYNRIRWLVPSMGHAAPPAGLTAREIACVRLVARGLSDNAIAGALGIAASTAHEYVEKAKARLKTRSRAELAALAVELGVIEV